MQRPGGMGASSRAVVNTNFLLNTVHGIGSHNRREEVEDCWRQRRLEQQDNKQDNRDKQGTRLSNATGERRRDLPYQKAPVEVAAASAEDTRTFWAEQKERAMAATRAASPMEGALVSTVQTGTSVERCENKRKLGKVGCIDSDSSDGGAKLLAPDKKKKKRKEEKKDNTDKKKKKVSKKEKRKREGRDARDVDSNNVEESQREQKNLESDDVGAKRKKHKKRKEEKKHAKRRRDN